jgi:hypothetical protein
MLQWVKFTINPSYTQAIYHGTEIRGSGEVTSELSQ